MKIRYGQHGDDSSFQSPDDLFAPPAMLNFLLAYGEDGLDALSQDPEDINEQLADLVTQMLDAGLLERDADGRLRPTPRLVQGLEHRALLEIFKGLRPGVRDGHATHMPRTLGPGGERADGTRPYQFGDPLSEIALHDTLRNALARQARAPASASNPRTRHIDLREDDFELNNLEATAECATAVLIDLSGSMMRYGRHIAAKKVALGLRALVRRAFPLDTIDYIGFASIAEPLQESDLPLILPKPITTREYRIRVRVPLDQVQSGDVTTHPHFTNLHHALQLARTTLARRGAPNKQIFIITDGQPTAHLSAPKEGLGQTLNLIYPPDPASTDATLAEALRCQQLGIRLATFALVEEYEGMDWVGFVERLTRLTRGTAYYCVAGDLSATIMESYLAGRRKKTALG